VKSLMRRAAWILALACAAVAGFGAAGCSKKTTQPYANRTPVTTVFLQGPVDTMTYRVRLHWSGNDPDGSVTGFEIQFTTIGTEPADSAWQATAVVDSIFALPIRAGVAGFTFWVRAVDNTGARDPHPASMRLYLRNSSPHVEFYNLPHRRLGGIYHFLPVVTLQWRGSDPEGANTIAHYRLWLDGGRAAGDYDTLLAPSDTVFTLRMESFGDVSTPRLRTVHVQPVDEALAEGNVVEFTWQVDPYVTNGARVLLIDDYNPNPNTINNAQAMDSLYRNTVTAMTGGKFSLYETFDADNFRFPQDAVELLRHFDLVVWYNEATAIPTNFNVCGDAMRGYLQHGGRLFLSALSMVGQDRELDDVFHRYYLGVDTTFCASNVGQVDCNFTVRAAHVLRSGNPAAPGDSLQLPRGFAGFVDYFVPSDSTVTEFFLPYAEAGDDTTEKGYLKRNHVCGVTRTVAGGGRTTFLSFPLHKMTKFGNREAVLQRLLQALQVRGSSARRR
jgi:hypothetical protein